MTDLASADNPLTIDRVQRGRGDAHHVRLRLSGRWLGSGHPGEHEALLVVQLDGRRHRFPPTADESDASSTPGAWAASFSIPSWAEPTRPGQAALWVGNAVVPVPLPGSERKAPAPATAKAPPAPAVEPPPVEASDTSRGGPLADLLFKETISALHAELEQRSADAARLRGELAGAQSELEARSSFQTGLEAAHAELRVEVKELMEAVGRQRAELDEQVARAEAERAQAQRELSELAAGRDALREQLAAIGVSRDAAVSEAAGLRAELERLGTELAVTREQVGSRSGDLGEAERLLASARALTEQLRRGA